MPQVKGPTEEEFLQDIATHEMLIIRDNGCYRHIRCKRPETNDCSFDVLTWPGYLCVTGDMGCWLFRRLEDMFEFFRPSENKLSINPDYWGEKLLATDCHGIHDGCATQYDPDIFTDRIKYRAENLRLNEASFRELMDSVAEEVLIHADDGEVIAMEAAYNFAFHDDYVFHDFGEVDCRSYRYHFIWCLYAIVWTIQKYDASKTEMIKCEKKVTAKFLQAECGVRYWEDTTVNNVEDENGDLIPCRSGDNWSPMIDLDTGVIENWPKGTVADIHYKVCDAGIYRLLDAGRNEIAMICGYVPKILSPGDNGFGDYVIMKIDGDGKIANWHVDLSEFERRMMEPPRDR